METSFSSAKGYAKCFPWGGITPGIRTVWHKSAEKHLGKEGTGHSGEHQVGHELAICSCINEKANSLVCYNRQIAASRSREVILSLCSALVKYIQSAEPSAGLPSTKETWAYWRDSIKWTWGWLRACSICHVRISWESWNCSAGEKKAQQDLNNVFKYFMGGVKIEPGSSQWCTVTGQELVGTNWKSRKYHLNNGKSFFKKLLLLLLLLILFSCEVGHILEYVS